jgi:hypothetical protein
MSQSLDELPNPVRSFSARVHHFGSGTCKSGSNPLQSKIGCGSNFQNIADTDFERRLQKIIKYNQISGSNGFAENL